MAARGGVLADLGGCVAYRFRNDERWIQKGFRRLQCFLFLAERTAGACVQALQYRNGDSAILEENDCDV